MAKEADVGLMSDMVNRYRNAMSALRPFTPQSQTLPCGEANVEKGQEETKPGAKTRSLTQHRAGYKPYFARCCYPDRHRGHDTAGDGQNKSQLVAARRIVNDACYPGPHCTPPISATVIVPKIDP
jgi:hypothetical protein